MGQKCYIAQIPLISAWGALASHLPSTEYKARPIRISLYMQMNKTYRIIRYMWKIVPFVYVYVFLRLNVLVYNFQMTGRRSYNRSGKAHQSFFQSFRSFALVQLLYSISVLGNAVYFHILEVHIAGFNESLLRR